MGREEGQDPGVGSNVQRTLLVLILLGSTLKGSEQSSRRGVVSAPLDLEACRVLGPGLGGAASPASWGRL